MNAVQTFIINLFTIPTNIKFCKNTMYKSFALFVFVLIIADTINCYKKPYSLNQRKNHSLRRHKALARGSTEAPENNSSQESEAKKKAAQLARYIVHNSNWAAMGTTSLQSNWKGRPYVNIKSMSDGTKKDSSGTPYFYITARDTTVTDLEKDNSASIMMSMEQDLYCSQHDMDPEHPKCGHVVVLGQVDKLGPGTEEYEFAKTAMFERHSTMESWPESHHFFLAKMTISEVQVVDGTGGPKIIPLEMYYNTQPVEPNN